MPRSSVFIAPFQPACPKSRFHTHMLPCNFVSSKTQKMIRKLLTYAGAILALAFQSCTGSLYRHSYHLVKAQGRTRDQSIENALSASEENENLNVGPVSIHSTSFPGGSVNNNFSSTQRICKTQTQTDTKSNERISVTPHRKSSVKLLLKRQGGCMDGCDGIGTTVICATVLLALCGGLVFGWTAAFLVVAIVALIGALIVAAFCEMANEILAGI